MQIKHFVYVLLQQQKHLFFNWDIMREIQNHKYYRDNIKGRLFIQNQNWQFSSILLIEYLVTYKLMH